MSDHRVGSALRVAREALGLALDFGVESLEAFAWVAATVESSVYVPHSLVRSPSGIRFALANPPLRIGAFSSVRIRVDGNPVPPDRVRIRSERVGRWRTAAELSAESALELQAGSFTEFEVDLPAGKLPAELTVRLELQSVAIPPLVWMEFREPLGEAPPP